MLVVDRRLRDVAAWVQATTPQLVELMLARMHTEVPAYFDSDDPAFMDTARESIVANLEAVAEALQSGRERPAQLPPGAVEEALIAARQRMPWTLIDRTYRIGHAVMWEQLLVEVESWQLDSSERLDVLRVISHFLFQYIDHVAEGLADVHQAERDRQIRGRERRRIAWVREILADVADSSSGGDYDLARQHLAAVAWGADAERAILALVALMLRDERAARDFVARELGPLLDGGKRTQVLLDTLGAYVSCGWSAASTGARLGVHERTIGYRVATIEQRLGRPLAARREELGAALRLHAALDP